jgi:nucleoid-associated protein EbfC
VFDGLKNLGNFGALLKQAQNLGGQMGQISEEMRRRRVTGTAGGGMVEIEVNGLMEALRCHIDPQLIAQNDCELIEDLVTAAINQAISKGKKMHADAIRDLTGGLPLPGGFSEMMEKLAGGPDTGDDEGNGNTDKHLH